MINIRDLLEILMKCNQNQLKKLAPLEFELEYNIIKINKDGNLIKALYFNKSRTIVIYPYLVIDKEDLKKVILHELSHHFGIMDEKMISY